MKVRLATFTDLDNGLLECLRSFGPIDLTLSKAHSVFSDMWMSGMDLVVAVLDERVVGTAAALMKPSFGHGGRPVMFIEDVVVHPDYRRRGVASELVEHLVGTARRRNAYKVILSCDINLEGFYEECGFYRAATTMRLDLA